jgi:hypothetical protein
MGKPTLWTFTAGLVVGVTAAVFGFLELVRRAAEHQLVHAPLPGHPTSAAISWGEVWDHPEPDDGQATSTEQAA